MPRCLASIVMSPRWCADGTLCLWGAVCLGLGVVTAPCRLGWAPASASTVVVRIVGAVEVAGHPGCNAWSRSIAWCVGLGPSASETEPAAAENRRRRSFLGSQRQVLPVRVHIGIQGRRSSARETVSSQIRFCAVSCRGTWRRLVSRAPGYGPRPGHAAVTTPPSPSTLHRTLYVAIPPGTSSAVPSTAHGVDRRATPGVAERWASTRSRFAPAAAPNSPSGWRHSARR